MIRLIHAKFAKDKMRKALGLPEKLDKPALEKFDASVLALPVEDEIEDEEEEEEEEVIEELPEPEEELIEEEDFDAEELAVEEIMDELEEGLDEMELEEEDIMMMPDDLPEQLFLSGDLMDEMDIISEPDEMYIEEKVYDPMASLLERAKAALAEEEVVEETSEEELMKMELRDRITAFIVGSPDLAVKLFRVFFHQEKTSMKEGRF